ncbi:MAG: hypothetical protein K0R49_843 [Burkholderiales bacterium]|jgi:hypothetical protein|nr:hypothetical protein [Burkholderiales bacterium]
MQFHLLDILSTGLIGLIALVFMLHTYFKMRKNKCATICNGCSGGSSCSTKVFKADPAKKVISIKAIIS